jgi:hypothetical protein
MTNALAESRTASHQEAFDMISLWRRRPRAWGRRGAVQKSDRAKRRVALRFGCWPSIRPVPRPGSNRSALQADTWSVRETGPPTRRLGR